MTSKIVAEHGGEIFFESVSGQGTTFTIRLPHGNSHSIETDSSPTLENEPLLNGEVASSRGLSSIEEPC